MKHLLLLLSVLFVVSCSSSAEEEPAPVIKYTLTTSANPTTGGTVTPASGQHTEGATVEIVSMIKKRKRNFINIKAETTGLRVENPPKFFKSINVKYLIYSSDLTEKEAERYISLSLEKYCSVGSTINQKTAINHSFEIVR